jgi:hypothetical protein
MDKEVEEILSAMNNEIAENNFKDSLERFEQAAYMLLSDWDSLPEDSDIKAIISEKYPFRKGFSEVCHDISEWVEHTINQLKEKQV